MLTLKFLKAKELKKLKSKVQDLKAELLIKENSSSNFNESDDQEVTNLVVYYIIN